MVTLPAYATIRGTVVNCYELVPIFAQCPRLPALCLSLIPSDLPVLLVGTAVGRTDQLCRTPLTLRTNLTLPRSFALRHSTSTNYFEPHSYAKSPSPPKVGVLALAHFTRSHFSNLPLLRSFVLWHSRTDFEPHSYAKSPPPPKVGALALAHFTRSHPCQISPSSEALCSGTRALHAIERSSCYSDFPAEPSPSTHRRGAHSHSLTFRTTPTHTRRLRRLFCRHFLTAAGHHSPPTPPTRLKSP